jgi:hypothetical protein
LIALAGAAVETGVVMLTCSMRAGCIAAARRRTTVRRDDEGAAIRAGTVERVRPKMPRRAEPAENLSVRDRNISSRININCAPRGDLFLRPLL